MWYNNSMAHTVIGMGGQIIADVVLSLVDPQTLKLSLLVLISYYICAAVTFILIVVIWTAVKMLWWESGRKRANAQRREARFDADGQPLPPVGRGLCDRCSGAFEKVYHLTGGRRLCQRCYEQQNDEE